MAKGKTKLTREQILAAQDIKTETLDIPEWGGEVVIRGFTLAQHNKVKELATIDGEVDDLRATIITFIYGVIEPKFSLADYDDLRNKSSAVARVAKQILTLSGIGAGAIEQAIKNSEATQSEDSPTP